MDNPAAHGSAFIEYPPITICYSTIYTVSILFYNIYKVKSKHL